MSARWDARDLDLLTEGDHAGRDCQPPTRTRAADGMDVAAVIRLGSVELQTARPAEQWRCVCGRLFEAVCAPTLSPVQLPWLQWKPAPWWRQRRRP